MYPDYTATSGAFRCAPGLSTISATGFPEQNEKRYSFDYKVFPTEDFLNRLFDLGTLFEHFLPALGPNIVQVDINRQPRNLKKKKGNRLNAGRCDGGCVSVRPRGKEQAP